MNGGKATQQKEQHKERSSFKSRPRRQYCWWLVGTAGAGTVAAVVALPGTEGTLQGIRCFAVDIPAAAAVGIVVDTGAHLRIAAADTALEGNPLLVQGNFPVVAGSCPVRVGTCWGTSVHHLLPVVVVGSLVDTRSAVHTVVAAVAVADRCYWLEGTEVLRLPQRTVWVRMAWTSWFVVVVVVGRRSWSIALGPGSDRARRVMKAHLQLQSPQGKG